jgi:glycosyltransferase involved in cell wall biosynthesis
MGRPLRIGLYSPYFGATFGGGEKYLALTASALHAAFPAHALDLIGPVPADPTRYERMLNVDLSGIGLRATNRRVTPVHRALNRAGILRPLRNRVVGGQGGRVSLGYELFVHMAYAIPVRCHAPHGVVLCQFPYPLRSAADLDGYGLVVCQSQYVRRWIGRLWDRDAIVVSPPVDVPAAEPRWSSKERLVLSVGRFIGEGHAKRQDLMVHAFRRLVAAGLEGWELHLAGAVHRDAVHAGYFERVQALARGLPVHLYPDASYSEVQDLYGRASIYWHAAGYGVDDGTDPAGMEHFGMTTAEAMAHGAVPVVFAGGGQVEVVDDGDDGFWWREMEELQERTLQLASDSALRRRLGERARAASRRFSRERFAAAIVAALGGSVGMAEADGRP